MQGERGPDGPVGEKGVMGMKVKCSAMDLWLEHILKLLLLLDTFFLVHGHGGAQFKNWLTPNFILLHDCFLVFTILYKHN